MSYPGVHFLQRAGKWRSQIHSDGKMKHLGLFVTEAEGIRARKAAENAAGRGKLTGAARAKKDLDDIAAVQALILRAW